MVDRFALTRWDPLRGLTPLHREVARLLGDTQRWFDRPLYFRGWPLTLESEYFAPMEVFDRDGHTVVKLEVPGVEMKDIDISLADGMLTIKGEKKHEEEIKEENYYHSERSYGSFRRTLLVPKGIDESKVSATFDSGVLEVSLPKVEEKPEHKVKVKAKKATK
jgi:HSP20 family protein